MESIIPLKHLFLISGPSGVGKTTTCNLIVEDKELNLVKNITYTTRAIRTGERDGVDYHFITVEEFQRKIQSGQMLEWNKYAGNYYGTSKDGIDSLRQNHNVLSIIEVNGKENIEKYYKSVNDTKVISIFFLPPTESDLRTRLEKRFTNTEAEIESRLAIARVELEKSSTYHETITLVDLESSIHDLQRIIKKYI